MSEVDIIGLGAFLIACGVASGLIGAYLFEERKSKRAAYVAWGISAFFLLTVVSRVWWNFVTN